MAITYFENGKKKVRNGNKKKNTIALIKRIEDMKNLSESELNDAIRTIHRTSGSVKEKRKRMNNLLNDVSGV